VVFDGAGRRGTATLLGAAGGGTRVEVHQITAEQSPGARLTVALAAPKGARSDWAVEKLTELGVDKIVWLACARGVVEIRAGGTRLARFVRIAQAAARQAGRSTVPAIQGPVSIAELAAFPEQARFVADFSGAVSLCSVELSAARPVVLAIGPEGGFTAEELEALHRAQFSSVLLGGYVLRTETAAVAGAAQLLGRHPSP